MNAPCQTTAQRATRKTRARAKQEYAQTLHACEEAAVGIKSAGDALAACWEALRHELSLGVSPTELLRTRAWCNVLELRLKEQAHALEDARRSIDAVWEEMVRATGAREMIGRFLDPGKAAAKDGEWPFLAEADGALNRTAAVMKT